MIFEVGYKVRKNHERDYYEIETLQICAANWDDLVAGIRSEAIELHQVVKISRHKGNFVDGTSIAR